jgi:ribonucleoside-diphosphate reductase beta chain
MLKRKKLFNVNGNDAPSQRLLIGGNTTNLMNLNSVKYKWAVALFDKMIDSFWIPSKVDLTQDVNHYSRLTPGERRAYDGVLSFLVFLDSLQTNNVPNFANYITAPEVAICLTAHAFQEAIHSKSYQYVIESVIPSDRRESIYDFWRDNEILLTRNQYIAGVFQDFIDTPTQYNFNKALIANYLLESLYFYNGFQLFYNFCSRHLMVGTADMITYINFDEQIHSVLFARIINELITESFHPVIYEMTERAVEQEILWTNHIMNNQVLGINEKSTEEYTKYLANQLLMRINLNKLYPGYDTNPYKHLELISDVNSDASVRGNFFEATVTSYSMASSVDGWDDF